MRLFKQFSPETMPPLGDASSNYPRVGQIGGKLELFNAILRSHNWMMVTHLVTIFLTAAGFTAIWTTTIIIPKPFYLSSFEAVAICLVLSAIIGSVYVLHFARLMNLRTWPCMIIWVIAAIFPTGIVIRLSFGTGLLISVLSRLPLGIFSVTIIALVLLVRRAKTEFGIRYGIWAFNKQDQVRIRSELASVSLPNQTEANAG